MNLETIYNELQAVGIPVEKTWGGLFVNDVYLVQLSKIHNPRILLDIVGDDGHIKDMMSFNSTKDLIQYLMEN